jgi:hypothetical protein
MSGYKPHTLRFFFATQLFALAQKAREEGHPDLRGGAYLVSQRGDRAAGGLTRAGTDPLCSRATRLAQKRRLNAGQMPERICSRRAIVRACGAFWSAFCVREQFRCGDPSSSKTGAPLALCFDLNCTADFGYLMLDVCGGAR